MRIEHHARNNYCTNCGRWHSHCDGCGWIWYGACTFAEALRHIRLHQLDKVYFEHGARATAVTGG